MKSILSVATLQRILDHYGVGTISDVTYFQNIGRNIWRHYIETDQGNFELYSYPTETREYSEPKLSKYLDGRYGKTYKEIVHSFERYHVLRRLTKKERISPKQADNELKHLEGMKIKKAFRVYGTIFQIHLENADVNMASVLVSYGRWNIEDHSSTKNAVLADTTLHDKYQLDEVIQQLENAQPTIQSYSLKDDWFELLLSNNVSLHFMKEGRFPAIEVHMHGKKNNLHIFSENEIYYTRDL